MIDKDDLIYELIFSDETEFTINMKDYIKKIHRYEKFIEEIRDIIFKGKVNIISEEVEVVNVSKKIEIIWTIKLSK